MATPTALWVVLLRLYLLRPYYHGCTTMAKRTMAVLLWLYYYGCTTMVGARHRLRDLAAARRDLAGDALLAPAAGRLVT